jgi:hypothetical protein
MKVLHYGEGLGVVMLSAIFDSTPVRGLRPLTGVD